MTPGESWTSRGKESAGIADSIRQSQARSRRRLKLKVLEKEEQIASMQRQIEELKRRANRLQQLQERFLNWNLNRFSREVPRTPSSGRQGRIWGRVLQSIIGPLGQHCGSILWESKRTKNWSDGCCPNFGTINER